MLQILISTMDKSITYTQSINRLIHNTTSTLYHQQTLLNHMNTTKSNHYTNKL